MARKHLEMVIVLLACLIGGCAKGMMVHRVSGAPPDDGRYLVYALPRTVITVDLPLTRTVTAPGVCAKFLGPSETATAASSATQKASLPEEPQPQLIAPTDLERLDIDVNTKVASSITVGDVTLAQRYEGDPNQLFAIELHSDVFRSDKFAFERAETGELTSASLESSSKVVDTAVKTLSAAASIFAAAAPLGGEKGGAAISYCQEALAKIRELRRNRQSFVSGTATATNGMSKEALQLLLSELAELDAAYVALFEGEKKISTTTARCEYTPTRLTSGTESVEFFRFDNTKVQQPAGANSKESLRGICSVAPAFEQGPKDAVAVPNSEQVVQLKLLGDNTVATTSLRYQDSRRTSGLYFRVPVSSSLRLHLGTKEKPVEKLRTTLLVPQYGEVISLPGDADTNSASLAMSGKFGPAGGLVSLGHSTTAADYAALIESAGSSTKTVLDAVRARKDAKESAEVAALEREKQRLELEQQILKLRAEQSE